MEVVNIKINFKNIFILLLAFVVSVMFVKSSNIGLDEKSIYILQNLHNYSNQVEAMAGEVESIKTEIKDKEAQINKMKNDMNKYKENTNAIKKEINDLEFYNGFTDVRGPGLMVMISDNKTDNEMNIMDKIVHDVDVTIVINDLKNAGAEAIVVNGKRIVHTSEVVCAGALLRINNEIVSAPFIIKAIGNQDKLYAAVNEPGTYAYLIKNEYGIDVKTMKSYELDIPRYKSDTYSMQHIKISE